ncbi:MAG: LysR family transcriptional regulator, partial [Rhizobiaceae bacterium]|nr:LysR family transcriptional regulator [Rhizobiaceae bacterium]
HLHITQPALTKSLRTLEQSLGVRLVDRGPGGVRPTVYGEHLAAYAQLILSLATEAQQEIQALRGGTKGQLKIGSVPAALRVMVPSAARAFLKDRPEVRLSVIEGLNDTLLTALRRGVLDLVITVLPSERELQEVEFRVLQEEPMAIIAHPSHPLAGVRSVSIEQLAEFGWVVPERLEPDRRQLERLFSAARLPAPNVVAETTSVTLLPAMLAGTTYVSYLPASSVGLSNDSIAFDLSFPTWTRTTIAAFRQKGPVRPLLGRFLSELEAAAKKPAQPPASS